MVPADTVRRLPKVLLHDHLDGGLRPGTVVELAREFGYRGLPTSDPEELAGWFHRAAALGSLEDYLETFTHTVGVMRTPDAVERVAAECAEDLAADRVVYAEVRFAPELLTGHGMTFDEVVEAAVRGFTRVPAIEVGLILTAMRDRQRVREAAAAAIRLREAGVCGFDIAGPEAGFPPGHHRGAFDLLRRAQVPITIHAGEADGVESIADALDCGAQRLGHGLRIVDDIAPDGTLGPVARQVREHRVPLELCATSNVHTGAVTDLAGHPVDELRRLGFAVTVNTDNRLMSGVSLSSELGQLSRVFGWGVAEITDVMANAARAAFLPDDRRAHLADVVAGRGAG